MDSIGTAALPQGSRPSGLGTNAPDLARLTELAALLFSMPYAALTLIKGESHLFRIVVGFAAVEFRPQELAFETTAAQHPLVICDGSLDPRFINEPLIVAAPYVKFYAGVRLVDSAGEVLGTLAVMDNVARTVESKQVDGLATLGTLVAFHLEAQRSHDREIERVAAIETAAIALTVTDDSRFGTEHAMTRMGSWTADIATSEVDWSGDAQTLSNLDGENSTRRETAPCHALEWRARTRHSFEQCARFGTSFDAEMCIVNALGVTRWIPSAVEPVRDERGRIARVRGVFQDITDQRHAEETARKFEKQVALSLDSMTDAFFSVDHEWRFTHVNKEFERLLRRRRQDVLGKVVWDEFQNAVDTPFESHYRQAVASKEAVVFEAFYPPVDCWFEVRAFPSEEGLAVYFLDVTTRRKADAMRRSLELKLRHAQHMESLGTLAGGIAHDFNHILAVILGNLELVRTDVGRGHVA